MQDSFELFDHTADVGIRVRSGTLPGLVSQSAVALYAVIGEIVATTEVEHRTLELRGTGHAALLRDFLAKLLTIFEIQDCVAHALAVEEFSRERLVVSLRLAAVEPQGTVYHREVKAVTYHELAVAEIPGGYEATIILDI